MGADLLVGTRIGALLDERDACPRAPPQDRRGATGEARPDDHRVVVGPSYRHCSRCWPLLAVSCAISPPRNRSPAMIRPDLLPTWSSRQLHVAMRLSGTSYAVLSVLDALGPATPYDLKQALEVSVQNFWPVPHTTAYSEPERLARAGLLSVEQEPSGRRRKVYSLTGAGREALREWAASPSLSPPQLREEGVLKIFAGADGADPAGAPGVAHREAGGAAGLSGRRRRGSRRWRG